MVCSRTTDGFSQAQLRDPPERVLTFAGFQPDNIMGRGVEKERVVYTSAEA
jgi:hypothetical protein